MELSWPQPLLLLQVSSVCLTDWDDLNCDVSASGVNTAASVSTSHKPFTIHFHTDYSEAETPAAEDANTDIGFSISYSQVAC